MIAVAKPANELDRLLALRSYGLLDSAREINFDSVASLAAKLTGAATAMVTLVDDDRLWVKAGHATDLMEASRDHAFCAHAILDPAGLLVIPDTHQDARFADNPFVTGASGIRFYAGQPLVNPQGLALGALCIVDPEPRGLSDEQRYTLKILADLLIGMLELRRSTRIDPVTKLLNRTTFAAVLDEAVAAGRRNPVVLLCLELDGVGQPDLPGGSEAGDRLLCDVARSLSAPFGTDAVVARTGAAGFAVLMRRRIDVASKLPGIRAVVAAAAAAAGCREPVLSAGAVTLPAGSTCDGEALKLAGEVLQSARSAGQDRFAHRVVGTPASNPASGPQLQGRQADARLEPCA